MFRYYTFAINSSISPIIGKPMLPGGKRSHPSEYFRFEKKAIDVNRHKRMKPSAASIGWASVPAMALIIGAGSLGMENNTCSRNYCC